MNTRWRIIRVVDYYPGWPEKYQAEREALLKALGDMIVQIHHIGSTAVPGLAAKPIIDILPEVTDINELDRYNSEMEKLGYTARGEYGIPGRRYFHKGEPNRTHHLHAFNVGSDAAIRHIAFRDYLIAHPQIAMEYGELKRRCARVCDNDIEKYGDLKNDFIKFHEKQALQWMRRS
jgi:GrpB-like predicted nucleotidyltransferase (UPF0157 family)